MDRTGKHFPWFFNHSPWLHSSWQLSRCLTFKRALDRRFVSVPAETPGVRVRKYTSDGYKTLCMEWKPLECLEHSSNDPKTTQRAGSVCFSPQFIPYTVYQHAYQARFPLFDGLPIYRHYFRSAYGRYFQKFDLGLGTHVVSIG